jgi:rhodanese-related sulfurtransferase
LRVRKDLDMKKTFSLIIILALILTACQYDCACNELLREDARLAGEAIPAEDGIVSGDTPPEYKKITPEEAIEMMGVDVIILDVRTQEEYAAGYIEGAILLPNYEISEKIEELIPDKEQAILIYCRSGRRSENAAKELLEMGYTNVYDFGGIETDWTGVVVIPDGFSIRKQIHENLPPFTFTLTVFDIDEFFLSDNAVLTISSADGSFLQEFSDIRTHFLRYRKFEEALKFDDWNFDGYLDISLWRFPGGSMGNRPHYFWLWNPETEEFTENFDLGQISSWSRVEIDYENNLIISHVRDDNNIYFIDYWKYHDGNFEYVRHDEQ